MACELLPTNGNFASAMLGFFDCQAITLGSRGYSALAAPGSTAAVVLIAMLTVLIAVTGYRMLFAQTPSLREGVLTFVKIGIVLAFATTWPAYQAVVFDVALRTPAELAGEIGRPAGLPGADGGLAGRLDDVDRQFRVLAAYGAGIDVVDQRSLTEPVAPPLFVGFDAFALGASRVVFLIGAVGAFALMRLAAGLLLALGPLFLAFLLFDATRGLFEGWARALIGTVLGALGVAVTLGVEMTLFEPWLAELVARRTAGQPIAGVPTSLLATTAIFALIIAGLLVLFARIAAGLRLPAWRGTFTGSGDGTVTATDTHSSSSTVLGGTARSEVRSRAALIADSIAAGQRREEQLSIRQPAAGAPSVSTVDRGRTKSSVVGSTVPLGRSFNRRMTGRVSASVGARDRRA